MMNETIDGRSKAGEREADREKGRDEYQQANQKRHHCGRNREWQSTTAENIPT